LNIITHALNFLHLTNGHEYHDHLNKEYALYKHIEHIDEPVESAHCKYCEYDTRTQQEKDRDNYWI